MEDYVDEAMENEETEEEATEEDEERGHLLRRTFQPYGIAGLRTYGAGLRTYGAGLHRGLSYGLNYRPAAVYGHNLGFRPTVYGAAYGARPAVYSTAFRPAFYGAATYGAAFRPAVYGATYGAAVRPAVYGATYGAAFRPNVYGAGYGIRRPFAYGTGLTHRPALWGGFGRVAY